MSMNEATKFIRALIEERVSNIHTAMPCRVESISSGRARVVPLIKRKFKDKPAEDLPLLVNLPAVQHRYQVTIPAEDYTVSGGTYSVSGGAGGTVTIPDQTITVPAVDTVIDAEGPFFQAGDIVLVSFFERASGNAIATGQSVDPQSNRKHDLSDGIIIGIICDAEVAP